MIFALAQYGCGHSALATQLPIWVGLSVSKRTMERRIEEWVESYDQKVKRALRNVTNLLCVFDNLQQGRLLQFQQGQSSIFTKVTARFVMSMYIVKFASGVILDFMVLHGLLKWDENNSVYKPGDDWTDKWLFVVGDGLSLDRMFQFMDDIMSITDSKKMSFRQAYKQAMYIAKVVHRVVPVNGDLHVRFHMLDSIFRLFYGGFLQCFQHRLKWKRIDGSDVTNTYRMAHRLAILVYEELDRLLLDSFVCHSLSSEKVEEYLSNKQPDDLAVFIAKEYVAFIRRQVRESKDWLQRFLCNYLIIVRMYMSFLQAEQEGDAIAMESVAVEYLPIFHATGKTNSFNTQMRLMELYYHRLPIAILQQIRLNRTKRQKLGSRPSLMHKESALDQIMERLMPFFKGMNHSGTEASYVRVSQMLTACQRAKHFVEFYTINRSDGEFEFAERLVESNLNDGDNGYEEKADPGKRNKNTIPPTTRMNRVLVTELLVLAKCHEKKREKGAMVVDKNHFWRALDSTTLEVQKKVRRQGDGKVKADAVDEYVMVKVQEMMSTATPDQQQPSKLTVSDPMDVDDESEIDIEKAIKEQDEEDKPVDDGTRFYSDDETAVVDVEEEAEFYGKPVTDQSDCQEMNDSHEGMNDSHEGRDEYTREEADIQETQVEDIVASEGSYIADEAEDIETLDDEEEDDMNSQENEGQSTEKKESDTVSEQGLREKKNVKGMKVVPLNIMAADDVISKALEKMSEKNVIAAKQRDADRKEREHHFLRYRLFGRLEEMEKEGTSLGWTDRDDEDVNVGVELDDGLDEYEFYKESLM